MDMELQSFVREVQARYEKKLIEREMEVITYWKEQLDRLAIMKPEGIASLQTHIKKLSEMMANRVATLKKK